MTTLSECLAQVRAETPTAKLEALDLWLSARRESALCVGCVELERRCSVRAHGVTFQAVGHGGGWSATWDAILAAVTAAEQFERAQGAYVG